MLLRPGASAMVEQSSRKRAQYDQPSQRSGAGPSAPMPKRPRLPVFDDDMMADGSFGGDSAKFQKGAIRKMVFHNFMTYAHAEFEPGPRLNVVMAPNGCGKSTIVAGLCLALSGDMRIMNRAVELKDYVRRVPGVDSGYVEVHLHEGPVIRHVVNSHSKEHQYFLDDQKASHKRVKEVVASFGIQIDNLTQFLPQERVADFAGMTPTEVLAATQRAVLGEAHEELHRSLIEKRAVFVREELELKRMSEEKAKVESLLADAQADVDRYNRQVQLLKDADLIKAYIPQRVLEAEQVKGRELKAELDAAERQLESRKRLSKPFQQQLDRIHQQRVALDQELEQQEKFAKKLNLAWVAASQRLLEAEEEFATRQAAIPDVIQVMERKKRAMDTVRQQLEARERELHDLEQAASSKEEQERHRRRMDELDAELRDVEGAVESVGHAKQNLVRQCIDLKQQLKSYSAELKQLQDVSRRRFHELSSHPRFQSLIPAQKAITERRQRGEALGDFLLLPMHIQCSSRLHALYLDAVLSKQDFFTYICSAEEDQRWLMQLSQENQWGLRIIYNTDVSDAKLRACQPQNIRRPCDIASLGQYGVTHWLDQTFECPDVIRWVLCSEKPAITQTACGTAKTAQHAETLRDVHGCLEVACPDVLYSSRRSRYRDLVTTQSSAMSTRSIFFSEEGTSSAAGASLQMLHAKIAEIEEGLKVCEERIGAADAESQGLLLRRDGLEKEHRALSDRQNAIVSLKRKVATDQQRHRDQTQSYEQAQQQQRDAVARMEEYYAVRLDILQNQVTPCAEKLVNDGLFPLDELTVRRRMAVRLELSADEALKQADGEMKRLVQVVKDLQQRFANLKSHLRAMKQHAETELGMVMDLYRDMTEDDILSFWKTLPEAVEDASLLHERKLAEANAIVADANHVRNFEALKLRLHGLEATVAERTVSVDGLRSQVTALQIQWGPPLEDAVREIDAKFRDFCREMGIAGEVLIQKSPDPALWSIEIMVMFREQHGMHRLSGAVQSGGEKSLTTITYLLSLQQLSRAPFRVVDEINQGLDQKNERKVFLQMNKACLDSDHGPQYFLITPKLLENLIPNDATLASAVTIVGIFNGPFSMTEDQFQL